MAGLSGQAARRLRTTQPIRRAAEGTRCGLLVAATTTDAMLLACHARNQMMLDVDRTLHRSHARTVVTVLAAWLPMVSSALAATAEPSARQPAPGSRHAIVDEQPPANPWTKLAGDFNGDGKLDVAIGGQNGPLVWYANPDWLKVQVAERGWSTVGGAAGDVDGDGDVDIVPGAQIWFENPGPKGDPAKDAWHPHRISEVGTHDVALVDLDRDGQPDLVGRDQSSFGHNTGNRIHFWRQQGPDAWSHHAVDCPHGEGLAVADLDRDGDMDVVIGGRWLENDGGVNGAWPHHPFTTNWTWADTKVALGDINGDGRLDVVLAPAELQGQRYRLAWYEGPRQTTQPDWPEHVVETSVEAVMHGLAVADMDGDGRADIVAARMHQGAPPREVSVHLNTGKGDGWRKVVVSERGSHDILVADFNGDGRPDILGANHGGPRQAVELWLSHAPPRAYPGLLRVHPTNARYFTDGTRTADGSLRALYLGGHQIFVDLQDNSFNKEWTKDLTRPADPAARARNLDWDRYLDFLSNLDFNYVRSWIIWSTGSGKAAPPHRVAHPMPFSRTGPGTAHDGGLKFDLRRFDDAFFQRLHDRARALRDRGIYLSVMLFELYGFLDGEEVEGQRLWDGNLFNGANNVNGVDVDRNQNRLGEEFFSLDDPAVVRLQRAYVEKMADALNNLDNVLWEICNEAPADAIDWQYEMLRHLKAYEARKPKQHLILLSPGGWVPGGWRLPPEEKFTQSPADFIATANGWIDKADPKVYQPGRPVMMDMDHVGPGDHEPSLIWKAFTRGYHFSLYETPFEQPQQESLAWQIARENLTLTRLLAQGVRSLAQMNPRPDLASTGYCLANEGQEYVVFSPKHDAFEVRGLRAGQTYGYEWLDTLKPSAREVGSMVARTGPHRFQPPGPGAVLLLTPAGRSNLSQ